MTYFNKLFYSISIFTLLVFTTFGTFLITIVVNQTFDNEIETAISKFESQIYVLNSQMAQAINSEDQYKEYLSKNYIQDESFIVIFENDRYYMDERLLTADVQAFLDSNRDTVSNVIDYSKLPNEPLLALSTKTINEKMTVYYFRNLEPIIIQSDNLIRYYQISLIMFVVVSLLISYYIVRVLTKPINSLVKGINELRNNKSESTIVYNSNDEFKVVTDAFNEMQVEINQHIESIHEAQVVQKMYLVNFAHEIKTPLTSIIGYAQLIKLKAPQNTALVEHIEYIVNEGYRLRDISTNLLKLQGTDKSALNIEKIRSQILADDIQDFLKSFLIIESIVLLEDGILNIDFQLFQVLCRNLIINAINAKSTKLVIQGSQSEGTYILSFQDNGVGISKEKIDRIFEPFYKISHGDTKTQSTGLGLYIVNKIVYFHNATIQCESEVGVGTTINIIIGGE